jgi:hypothetical protein
MHVALDMDDVLLDFFGGVLDAFEREYGVRPDWDGAPWGPKAVAFTKHPLLLESGYKSWWDWLRDRSWLWANFPAIPGAVGGVARLRADGHFIEVVTSKPDWAEHNVWKWLGLWRPPVQAVTLTKQGERKVDRTDADIIVDDKLATCTEFVQEKRQAVWFNRGPERLDGARHHRLYEAHDWTEVVEVVRKAAAVHAAAA